METELRLKQEIYFCFGKLGFKIEWIKVIEFQKCYQLLVQTNHGTKKVFINYIFFFKFSYI